MAQPAATSQKEGPLAHVLPPLPYPSDALEPYIDKMTMEIHHDKHHAAYVNNLNKALESHPDLQQKTVEELLRSIDSLPEAGRTAGGRAGRRHRPGPRRLRCLQAEAGRRGHRPVRLGLGLAGAGGRQAGG